MDTQHTDSKRARSILVRGVIGHAACLLGEYSHQATVQSVLRAAARAMGAGVTGPCREGPEAMTSAEYAEAVTWLAQQLAWDLQYQLASDHIRFTGTHCPFSTLVMKEEGLRRLWCESLGRNAADIFGYGKVICKQRIALGQEHCDIKIFVKHTAQADVEAGVTCPFATDPCSAPESDAENASEETVPQLKAKVRLLEQRAKELEEALGERKLIEKAKGILMKRLQLSEPEAMRKLQKESQHRNVKLVEIARIIVQAGEIIS